MPTVKQLKAQLKKLGVDKEIYKGMRKSELEKYLEKIEGGGNGDDSAGAAAATSSPKSDTVPSAASKKSASDAIQAAVAAAGPAAVTSAAADAGVVARSPKQTRKRGRPSPQKGAKQKTKKARDFLKAAERKFGTVKSNMKLIGTKRAGVMNFPGRTSSTSPMEGVEGAGSIWPPQLPEGMEKLDFSRTSPTFRLGKKAKKGPDYSKRRVSVKFKNIHNEPVMLKTSWLPPSFNPRRAAIFPILGHNNPLDPGSELKMEIPAGLTIYAVNRNSVALESFVTTGNENVSPKHTLHAKSARPGKVEVGGFELEELYTTSPGASSSPKSKKGGRRKRRRRTRRRRKRRQRRTRRGGELFGFRRWVKKKTGYTASQEKKRIKKEEQKQKKHRTEIYGNLSRAPDDPFNPYHSPRTNG